METLKRWLYPRTAGVPQVFALAMSFAVFAILNLFFRIPGGITLQHALVVLVVLLVTSILIGALTVFLKPSRPSFDGSPWQAALYAAANAVLLSVLLRSWSVGVPISVLLGLAAHLIHRADTRNHSSMRSA
ncbi:MAG: hypothetical protein Q8P31_00525 [Bacillota bacterium]|nr:hypothetical protein [Bacillota bacterium]